MVYHLRSLPSTHTLSNHEKRWSLSSSKHHQLHSNGLSTTLLLLYSDHLPVITTTSTKFFITFSDRLATSINYPHYKHFLLHSIENILRINEKQSIKRVAGKLTQDIQTALLTAKVIATKQHNARKLPIHI